MEKRYVYQQGYCKALSLNGLNPILFEGEGGKNTEFHIVEMVCSAIEKGICDFASECEVFLAAKDVMNDDGSNMVKEKYKSV